MPLGIVNLNARDEIMTDMSPRTRVMPLDHRMFAHNPGGFYAEQCLGSGYVPTALYVWPAATADALARAARESSGPMVTTEEIAERLAKRQKLFDFLSPYPVTGEGLWMLGDYIDSQSVRPDACPDCGSLNHPCPRHRGVRIDFIPQYSGGWMVGRVAQYGRMVNCPNCDHKLYYAGETIPGTKTQPSRQSYRVTCDGSENDCLCPCWNYTNEDGSITPLTMTMQQVNTKGRKIN